MDLTGIEGFTNLQYFYADHNLFQVADLRHNHSLSQIDIGNNDSLRQVYFPDTGLMFKALLTILFMSLELVMCILTIVQI